jgi:transcriptional regulator with XRE-family HTH domain
MYIGIKKQHECSISRKFRRSRLKNDLTLEKAAAKAYMGVSTLGNYEAGRRMPAPNAVASLVNAYDEPELAEAYCQEVCPLRETIEDWRGRATRKLTLAQEGRLRELLELLKLEIS